MARAAAQGDVIGGFRLEQEISPGAQANLWRVRRADAADGADAAFPMVMKIPLVGAGDNPLAIVAFETEAMILPRLSGPHVPRFVAAGDFAGPYIVIEYIAGRSLKSLLPKLPLPYDEVAAIGAAVASALHDIHGQHVLHLDLKPGNVILRDDGEAVLIDFGLSCHQHLPDLPAEEFDGPIGTGAYIAPEQLRLVRADPRSDLFALGVILYFFATGERPFGDPVRLSQWRARLYRDPIPPRRRRPDCPPWLQDVILRCLERDPDARYHSAAQLAFDLRHPGQIKLGERARRIGTGGFLATAARWLRQHALAEPVRPQMAAAQLARAPIAMVAVDLDDAALARALLIAAGRLLRTEDAARLACINVFKLARLGLDTFEDKQGHNIHLTRLAQLKAWAHPLGLPDDRVTFHVIEAADAAAALIEFARRNHADQIIVGARASGKMRRYLGSVSAQVVAEAPCSVTVVRAR